MSRTCDIIDDFSSVRAPVMLVLTYLPAFVTTVFRGMPGVWKNQHRLLLCWLIVLQAVYPGRKTLEELHRWSPAAITAWRFRRLLNATYWSIGCGSFGTTVLITDLISGKLGIEK